MRVAILSSGRFHVLDLARELARLGHDVVFYSLVPTSRAARFGVPAAACRWLGPWVGPLWLAERALATTPLGPPARRALVEAIDLAASRIIGPCDAFIGMSGMSLRTIERVRRRYGAVTFVERASLHIRDQQRILDARPRAASAPRDVPDWVVAREEAEYLTADYVSVPAQHAAASFIARGFPAARIVTNPLGVSLAQFPATPAPPDPPRILTTSAWTWQKGSDLLAAAFARVRAVLPTAVLEHVGPVGEDVPLPQTPGFEHHAPIPQARLSERYARAHVMALPSRQDGFPIVLAQALASGVPIVCSTRTSGPDLAARIDDAAAVTLIPPDDAGALADALLATLARRPPAGAPRELFGVAGREGLTWEAYGARWHETLERLVGRPRGG